MGPGRGKFREMRRSHMSRRVALQPAMRQPLPLTPLLPPLLLVLLAPLARAPPRPPQPGGPMFEQKAAGGRVIITSDDPTFDPSILGLGDPPPPPPPPRRKPHPLSVVEQEAMEAAAVAEAIAAPLVGADGEDRTAPAPRDQSGAGRRDDTHAHPGAALFQKQQHAGGRKSTHGKQSMDEEFFTTHVLPKLGARGHGLGHRGRFPASQPASQPAEPAEASFCRSVSFSQPVAAAAADGGCSHRGVAGEEARSV